MMINSDFLICGYFNEDKRIFYQFVMGEIDLLELEKELYNNKNLELIIDSDLYVELVTQNFKNPSNYEEILRFIHENLILDSDSFFDWNLCKLFKSSGWKMKNDLMHIEEEKLAFTLCRLYGGLTIIGEDGNENQVQAKNDIIFMESPLKSFLDSLWHDIIGDVLQVGICTHGEIILFIDKGGYFYIYIDGIDRMYHGGRFRETMNKLLFGWNYGEIVKKLGW